MRLMGQCWGRASVRRCFFAACAAAAALGALSCTYWIQGGITTSGGGFNGGDAQGRERGNVLPTTRPVRVAVKMTVSEPNALPE